MKMQASIHKTHTLILISALFLCFANLVFADQDRNIDQFGVQLPPNTDQRLAHIDGVKIDQSGNGVIILNDQPFRVTAETRYYNSYNKRVGVDNFMEQYKYVAAHINSRIILAIWPENNEDESIPRSSKSKTPGSTKQENNVVKDNGVWKN